MPGMTTDMTQPTSPPREFAIIRLTPVERLQFQIAAQTARTVNHPHAALLQTAAYVDHMALELSFPPALIRAARTYIRAFVVGYTADDKQSIVDGAIAAAAEADEFRQQLAEIAGTYPA